MKPYRSRPITAREPVRYRDWMLKSYEIVSSVPRTQGAPCLSRPRSSASYSSRLLGHQDGHRMGEGCASGLTENRKRSISPVW